MAVVVTVVMVVPLSMSMFPMTVSAMPCGIGTPFGPKRHVLLRHDQVHRAQHVGQHMVHNSYLPKMEIDAQTYSVRADGVLLTCEPVAVQPMAQRYFLF